MLKQNQVHITLCEAQTGIILNEDGTRFIKTPNKRPFSKNFETVEKAQTFCQQKVLKYPYMSCTIFSTDHCKISTIRQDEWLQPSAHGDADDGDHWWRYWRS